MSEEVQEKRTETYVLYTTKYGKTWHRSPTCATTAEVPPGLDAAASLFDGLEMSRYGELDDTELCSNCAESFLQDNS